MGNDNNDEALHRITPVYRTSCMPHYSEKIYLTLWKTKQELWLSSIDAEHRWHCFYMCSKEWSHDGYQIPAKS